MLVCDIMRYCLEDNTQKVSVYNLHGNYYIFENKIYTIIADKIEFKEISSFDINNKGVLCFNVFE